MGMLRNPRALATKIAHRICGKICGRSRTSLIDCGEKVGKVISTRKASGQSQREKARVSERGKDVSNNKLIFGEEISVAKYLQR